MPKFDRFADIIKQLRKAGVPDEQLELIEHEVRLKQSAEPDPRIALIGFTGVGKSSTINALFNAGHEIGHVRACTQEAREVHADVKEYTGSNGSVVIYDMPGLGEGIDEDRAHFGTYLSVLPKVDVAVWIFNAGDRSMTAVQQALLQLRSMLGPSFVPRLMFAINKVDVTAPGAESWNSLTNTPSSKQRAHLEDFERYVHEKVVAVLPEWQGNVVSYSSRKHFRLDQLMTAMVGRAADDRAWLLDQRADVADFRKTISPEILAYIEEQEGLRKNGGAPWSDRRSR